ncbi:MAG TPA: DUF262 domain-containing protein [Verrucomicrobiae bacterium]|nr:DUF262 domain-containing protein [Verrucomicrobiae bacterium]
MKDTNLLFKEVGYNLGSLLDSIALGVIGLPEIQRPFVWKNTKGRDLFDSMYRGYPVGYLLLWQNANAEGSKGIGVDGKQKHPSLLIVDGQQRLTSLYAVVKGKKVIREDYSEEFIEIAFHPLEEKFEVADAAIRKDKHWIPNISRLWSPDTDLFELVDAYLEALKQTREVTADDTKRIRQSIQRLQGLVNYPFRALELLATVNEEQVSQVFVRINSKGQRLNEADFILTLMSVFWDEGRHELERFSRAAKKPAEGPTPYNHFLQPAPDQLLRAAIGYGFKRGRLQYVYSLLRGKDLETGEFSEERRVAQFTRLQEAQACALNLQHWKDFLKCLMNAGFRSGKVITSDTTVLYSYVFYLLGKAEYGLSESELRRAISRWFFFASLTGRFTSSPESALESDLIQLRDVKDGAGFLACLEKNIAAQLTDDFWRVTLPNDLDTAAARSPSLMAYLAALCLLDAKVLFSGLKVGSLLDPTTDAFRNSLERHHLFPKDWLKSNGFPEIHQTNQIANYALIEWPDNSDIGAQSPANYWPQFTDRYTNAEWPTIRYWHALPENWETIKYEDFLKKRRCLIAQVIRDGFEKI